MFLQAQCGSNLVSSCDNLEKVAYRRRRPSSVSIEQWNEVRHTLKYQMKLDALHIAGGFSLETSTFIGFMGFCIACIAIVLQFDYKLVSRLNSAVDHFRSINATTF